MDLHTFMSDGYFLSRGNPTANIDQRELEGLAIRIVARPEVLAAKQAAAQRWKTIMGPDVPEEAWARFEGYMEEWVFNYTLKAVNSDPNYPKVLAHVYGPPHEWFGMKVPGSRGAGDGPDTNYTIIPVDQYGDYVVTGRKMHPAPADAPFTLTGNLSLSMTLASIDWQDLVVEPDGSFTITIDARPANGRANHLQTRPDARWLFARDSRSDWREVPNALRAQRLNPPLAAALTEAQLAERACNFLIDDVAGIYWFIRIHDNLKLNTVMAPFGTGGIGGLVTQKLALMDLDIADDEAFVMTAGAGDAKFRDMVVLDYFWRSFNGWEHTSSFNNAQGIPNEDGSTTYIIAASDPGYHNWVSTVGLHRVRALHRWQGLPREAKPGTEPSTNGKLVKLSELERMLPPGMQRVTPEQRRAQIKERAETHQLRYLDV